MENKELKNCKKRGILLCVIGILCSIPFFYPAFRIFIIELGDRLTPFPINKPLWTNLVAGFGAEILIFFVVIGIFCCFPLAVKNAITKVSDKIICVTEKNIISIISLVVFFILNVVCVIFHEHFGDETNAWRIAKYCSPVDLFNVLPDEGHPALWYLFLMPFAKLGFPYKWMSYLSLSIVLIAAIVFMKEYKLPVIVKIIVLFSPIFTYFSPVISRSYCFLTLEIVLLGAFYEKRKEKPILWGILLASMLQTHIYLAGLSGMLLLQMLYEFILEKQSKEKKKIFIGGIIGGISVVFLLLELAGKSSFRDGLFSKMSKNPFVLILKSSAFILKSFIWTFSGISSGLFCTMFLMLVFLYICKDSLPLKKSWKEYLIFLGTFLAIGFIFALYTGGHWNHSIAVFTILLGFAFLLPWNKNQFMGFIFSCLLLYTWTTTAKFIIRDIKEPFSNSKAMAKYINENLGRQCKLFSTGVWGGVYCNFLS